MKLKLFILIGFMYATGLVNANPPDSTLLKYIENKTTKNILIYRIRNTFVVENDLYNGFLKQSVTFLNILPDNGCKFELEINRVFIPYPDSSIRLYTLFKKYDRFVCDSITIAPVYPYFHPDRYFLIGIDNQNEIKFISGNFYLSRIKNSFNLDVNNPTTFYKYLKLKAFQYRVKDIEFVKSKKKQLIFSGYSSELEGFINLTINKSDLDNVIIEKQ